jgi:hypothetical protein
MDTEKDKNMPKPKRPIIYFVQSVIGGPIKIGYTENLSMRMIAMQANCPFELKILATIQTDSNSSLEQEIHSELARFRLHGEWFEATYEVYLFMENWAKPFDDFRLNLSAKMERVLVWMYVETIEGNTIWSRHINGNTDKALMDRGLIAENRPDLFTCEYYLTEKGMKIAKLLYENSMN